MNPERLSRRKFLTRTAIGGSGLLLSGCKVLDDLSSTDNSLRGIVESANGLTYRVQRALLGRNALAKEFSRSELRQPQRPNGVTSPSDEDYLAIASNNFAGYTLQVGGMVERPMSLDLPALMNMPARTQITRHDCVEGWSAIAEWTGVPLSVVLKQAKPKPGAKYVLFRCYDTIGRRTGAKYYETIDMIDAFHPQTILAYGLNQQPLPVANGAPLRVRVERQLGYKMAKYLRSIELVDSFAQVEGGRGGYWEDNGYDWYAGI